MGYLAVQILLFLVLAALLGFIIGWLLKSALFRSETTASAGDAGIASSLRGELASAQREHEKQQSELSRLRDELANARAGSDN